jgi:hypothetical protein
VGRNPDLAGIEVVRSRRVVQESESSIVVSVIPLLGFLNNQKDDRVTALLKFCGKIDIVQERPAQIRHPIGEEDDFHCSYRNYIQASTRFV